MYDKVAGQLFLCDPEALDVVLRRHYTVVRPRSLAEFQRVHSTDYSNDAMVFNQHLTSSKSVDVIDEGVNPGRRKLWGTTSDLGLLEHENMDGQSKHQRFSSMGNDPLSLNGPVALNNVGMRGSLGLPCGSRDSAISSCSVFDSRSSSEGFGMSSDQLQGSTEDLGRSKKSSKQPVIFNSLGRKDKIVRNYHRNASLPPGITIEDEDLIDSSDQVIQSLDAIKNQLQDTFSDTPVEILVSPPISTGLSHITSTPNNSSPDDGITVCENGLDFFANTILSPELSATCEELMASQSTTSSQDAPLTTRAWTPAETSTPQKPRPSSCGISTYTGTSL